MNIVTSVLHLTLKRNFCSLFHSAYTYNTAPIYIYAYEYKTYYIIII